MSTSISAELRRLADALDDIKGGAEPTVSEAGKRLLGGTSANLEQVSGFAAELADVVATELGEAVGSEAEARKIGVRVAQRVCAEFAGQMLYVPFGLDIQISERDGALYQHYRENGCDAAATAKAFGMGVQNVYRRVAMLEACYRQFLANGRDVGATAETLDTTTQAVLRRVEIVENGRSTDRQGGLFIDP